MELTGLTSEGERVHAATLRQRTFGKQWRSFGEKLKDNIEQHGLTKIEVDVLCKQAKAKAKVR